MKTEFSVIKDSSGNIIGVTHSNIGKTYTVEYNEDDKKKSGYLFTINDYSDCTVAVTKVNYGNEMYAKSYHDDWAGMVYEVYMPEDTVNVVSAIKELERLFIKYKSYLVDKDLKIKYYNCSIN